MKTTIDLLSKTLHSLDGKTIKHGINYHNVPYFEYFVNVKAFRATFDFTDDPDTVDIVEVVLYDENDRSLTLSGTIFKELVDEWGYVDECSGETYIMKEMDNTELIEQLRDISTLGELSEGVREVLYTAAVANLGKWRTDTPDSNRKVIAFSRDAADKSVFLASYNNGFWRDEETGEVYNTEVDKWMEVPAYGSK